MLGRGTSFVTVNDNGHGCLLKERHGSQRHRREDGEGCLPPPYHALGTLIDGDPQKEEKDTYKPD